MATVLKAKGDALWKRDSDPGYRVGWRSRYGFEKSHLEGEMSYGEARQKAAELQAADPERNKIYFAELILEEETN